MNGIVSSGPRPRLFLRLRATSKSSRRGVAHSVRAHGFGCWKEGATGDLVATGARHAPQPPSGDLQCARGYSGWQGRRTTRSLDKRSSQRRAHSSCTLRTTFCERREYSLVFSYVAGAVVASFFTIQVRYSYGQDCCGFCRHCYHHSRHHFCYDFCRHS